MVFGSETAPYQYNCVLFYCFLTTSIILLKGRVGGATGLNTPVTAVRVTQVLIRHAALRTGEVMYTYYRQHNNSRANINGMQRLYIALCYGDI